jgi:hypothetical protein
MGRISLMMDTWSDQRIQPYLAITAHWIAIVGETSSLQLKSGLIAFHRLRKGHSGKALARVVMHLLDRAGITVKVSKIFHDRHPFVTCFLKTGHVTFDNASNNNTMMEELEVKMIARDIEFDALDRSVYCFGHIIELCSKRVVNVASGGAEGDGDDLLSSDDEADIDVPAAVDPRPVPKARSAVRVIRASGMRRDEFNTVIKNGNEKGWFRQGNPPRVIQVKYLQLLRDVRSRWDSMYPMLQRLREMRPVRHSAFLNMISAHQIDLPAR